MSESRSAQRRRYKYLAYVVIRDAIGFYFGIKKFKDSTNVEEGSNYFYNLKVKKRKYTESQLAKLKRQCYKQAATKVELLDQDYQHCVDVLTNDNIWLQLLDITPAAMARYLESLSEEDIASIAVVPKWSTQDHSLGRPYLNDVFIDINERTDQFS